MTLLCPLPGCRLVRVARDGPGTLTVLARARRDHARCPTCRAVSAAVHSRYHRRPADLPASGSTVRLQLAVRRFYCHEPACPRRTFAERFPHLLARHAQRTRRLVEAQARTGLALGGLPAARLLAHLAMPTSAATLLRAIRSVPLPNTDRPHVVGVDDWALRKGRTYGTIVVDLERHRPIDLLSDRSAETWAAWLRREPQIRLVARDRSTEYARGTTLGAPEAVQVADRWHLLLNTRQMIERWLARAHPCLKLLPPAVAPALSTQPDDLRRHALDGGYRAAKRHQRARPLAVTTTMIAQSDDPIAMLDDQKHVSETMCGHHVAAQIALPDDRTAVRDYLLRGWSTFLAADFV